MISQILSNRYRIINEVGSGGMAKVYQAEDLNSGQLVAVKVMYPQFSEDSSYVQRFVREAKLAELLDSPHIVKILDYGSSRDTHYLVMEYVEGESLRDVLAKRGALPWEEALSLIDQISRALETANTHNIVHRDIKPQNLMITEAGLLKVLDFGIARGRMLPSLTQSGFVGSPYYIAPEQAMGEEVDIRSDIYSTGIVLYELLMGDVPFDAKSPWSIISKHITADLPPLNIEQMAVPEGVQQLLKHMVAKRPDDRIQDPKILRQTITSLIAGGEFPANLVSPASATSDDTDPITRANTIYDRAEVAIAAESWQQALGLLNQVLDLYPDHPEAATQRVEVGQKARLSALYQAATRALEAGRWQEAIDELTEITKFDETFADTVTLIEQAQGMLQRQEAGDFAPNSADTMTGNTVSQVDPGGDNLRADRMVDHHKMDTMQGKIQPVADDKPDTESAINPQTIVGTKPASKKSPFKSLLAALIVVLLIAGGVWAVSQNQPEVTDAEEQSTSQLVAQAQTAFDAGNYDETQSLLTQILSTAPDNEAANQLREKVDQFIGWAEQLKLAQAAIVDADWTTAIETLSALRQNADYQPETVKTLLCDSYLARGQARLDQITNPRDKATVDAALSDFKDGQKICADNEAIGTQIDLATTYLTIFAPDVTVNSLIENISPLVETEPTYAGGQALQNLYDAYLNRGDILRLQADLNAALVDYESALALGVPDQSKARLKRESTIDALNQANPESVQPETINTDFRRGPTTLLGPPAGSQYEGEFTEIILQWEALNLADDEYYDVTVRWFVGEEPRYWGGNSLTADGGVQCAEQCSWRVPIEAGFTEAASDKYDWWVTIRQKSTDRALSPASEEWSYIWREG